jgi:hypothetical protein
VIAIEGAAHGILANTVLPFGSSRMVTDTVAGREQIPEELAFLDAIKPELVVPLVVYLASRDCAVSHRNHSACAGRFARVAVGVGEGWIADRSTVPTAEDVAAHFDEVDAADPVLVPMSIVDEVADVCIRLGIL